MTYKQFIQELEDDILPAEAERRYVLNGLLGFYEFGLFTFMEHLWF